MQLKTRQEPSTGRIIYKGTHSHIQSHSNMSTSTKFKITKVAIKYTIYGSYSISVEQINSCTASGCDFELMTDHKPLEFIYSP